MYNRYEIMHDIVMHTSAVASIRTVYVDPYMKKNCRKEYMCVPVQIAAELDSTITLCQ